MMAGRDLMTRPVCPNCGMDLVCLVIPLGKGRILVTYVCDCENKMLENDILDARMDASPDATLTLSVIPVNEDAAALGRIPKFTGFSLS